MMSPGKIRSQAERGGIAYYLGEELVAFREPGWYAPAAEGVIVTIGESTIDRYGFRIPVTVWDCYDGSNTHAFVATGIRALDGSNTIRRGAAAMFKCPDRPAAGYWRKIEGIQD